MDPEAPVRTHPVHAFTARLHERLDDLANASHLGMSVQDQGETVVELDRAIARLEGVKLRVLAAADRNDVGEATAATTPGWWAVATRCDGRRARKDVKLACALEGHRHRTGEALVGGAVSAEHAEVIDPEAAEERLAKQLEAEERRAARSTFLDTWTTERAPCEEGSRSRSCRATCG